MEGYMPLINRIDRNQDGYGTAIDDYRSWHDTLVKKQNIPIVGGFFCGAGLLLHDLKTIFFNNI